MTNLEYAEMMLEIYEDDEPTNFEAIQHYRDLVTQERERMAKHG